MNKGLLKFFTYFTDIDRIRRCVRNRTHRTILSRRYPREFIGHVHQDKTRCIYEAVLREGKVNMKFLSQFKYRRLLRINVWGQ